MNKVKILAVSLICLFAFVSSTNAAVLGPTYPAPGGNTFSGSGSGTEGGANWNYGGFDSGAYDQMWFGLNNTDYGISGAGLHGSANPFVLFSVSGTTAEWRADTTWKISTSTTDEHKDAQTRLLMDVSGLGTNPWITDLVGIGLGAFLNIGAVVDLSAGSAFSLNWEIEADTGSGWQNLNGPSGVQQHADHDGFNNSSFATGFYYTESVPAPGGLLLLALGFVAMGLKRRISA
ncbi:MAG: hypothetical protein ACI8Z1_002110 [Candidatus Azotimanducaceae bacterium]|jgi:hypothetical protein